MKVWIYLNGLQQGPYTMDQLRVMPLTPDTPVWYDGLTQWTPAGQAALTASLFEVPQPVAAAIKEQPVTIVEAPATQRQLPHKPSTYMAWNIILTILCCSPFALAGIVTGSITNSRYNSGDYAGARRMSHVTEWLLIISIVWMFIGLPVAIIFNGIGQ